MSNLKTSKAHNINCDELVFDTNNDAKNSHFNIRTTGAVGENDVEFKTCNVKVSDGSLHTNSIKDLDGNEVLNLSSSSHVIKDTAGDPIITIGDSVMDFHSATISNLSIGSLSLNTGDISSQNYGGQTLEHELDTIATNITTKLNKDGQTASKILTTSSGGVIQFSSASSLLTDIGTNGTNIGTIGSLATSATNLVGAVNEIHTEINTNTSNISTNSSNISTNTSNISTLDGAVAKTGDNETISGNYTFTGDTIIGSSVAGSLKLRHFTGSENKDCAILYNTASDITLTLPSSTGTLALTSDVPSVPSALSSFTNDSNFITASGVITGGNGSAGEMIQTNGDGTIGRTALVKATTASVNLNTNSVIVDNTTGHVGINGISSSTHDLAVSGGFLDVLANETTEAPSSWTGNFAVFRENDAGGGQLAFAISVNQTDNRVVLYSLDPGTAWRQMRFKANDYKFVYQGSTDLLTLTNTSATFDVGKVVVGDVEISQTNEINSSSGLFINDDVSSDIRLVNGGGEVGIGGNASFPLHVHGGQDQGSTTFTRISPEHKVSAGGANVYVVAARTTTNPTSIAGADSDGKIGIECDDCSVKAHYYFFNSDRRIKKDITDLSDNESLAIIRDISCVKYKYIDNVKRGKDWTYGFIANQVAEVFPNAVRLMNACVPDEMRDISNSDWSGNKILVPGLAGSRYKLYYGNGDKERHDTFDYVDGGFELDKKYSQVYLYGSEVNDFHVLDKSKIYAVLTSAVQELDKKVVVLESENKSLKERVEVLEKKLHDEETKTAYFQMRIDNLYSHLNL